MKIRTKLLLTLALTVKISLTSLNLYANDLPARKIIKEVPYVKQKKNYCAPAAATMLLKYYGAEVDQTLLAQLSSGQSVNHQGTSLIHLNQSIRKMGYETNLLDLNTASDRTSQAKSQKAFRTNTIPVIKMRIKEDKPVLYSIMKTGWPASHLILIIGYDDNKKIIYYMDPDLSRSKIHKASYKAFSSYGNILGGKEYYQPALLVEPVSDERYSKKRKKKDFEFAKNTSSDLNYIKQALLDLYKQSLDQDKALFTMLPASGFASNQTNRFDFENIDLLRPDLKDSFIKAKRAAKKHSVPAIENSLANKKIVVLIYKDTDNADNERFPSLEEKKAQKKEDAIKYLIITGYDRSSQKLNVLRPNAELNDYTAVGLTYKELINRLNMKLTYINKNGKEKKSYTHRVIVITTTPVA